MVPDLSDQLFFAVHLRPHVCRVRRVKLFNEGDRLASAERTRRLKSEYKNMSSLRWFIYWTDVGEVGYLDFQKRLKRKRLAQQADD